MDKQHGVLIEKAKEAIFKGFYTSGKPKRKYGAAVLTKSGKIFNAGQYSSFNHITSIHAEMGAIVTATMMGELDIISLALAGSEDVETLPRSCGVCLQFIKEHSKRTGLDIEIISASLDGKLVDIKKISEITENFWQ